MPSSRPSSSSSSSRPLLPTANNSPEARSLPLLHHSKAPIKHLLHTHNFCWLCVKEFLSSPAQHFTVLTLVSLDLLGIFADIIINLYQCDEGLLESPKWQAVRHGLSHAGLVFSCLFLAELICCVWAFGWSYFTSKFHIFDGIVILLGFITDVLLHGVLEEVASLVVILRLWRFFKIIEEFTVGAQEQMDGLEMRIEQLESENGDLKARLKRLKDEEVDGLEVGFQSGSAAWK